MTSNDPAPAYPQAVPPSLLKALHRTPGNSAENLSTLPDRLDQPSKLIAAPPMSRNRWLPDSFQEANRWEEGTGVRLASAIFDSGNTEKEALVRTGCGLPHSGKRIPTYIVLLISFVSLVLLGGGVLGSLLALNVITLSSAAPSPPHLPPPSPPSHPPPASPAFSSSTLLGGICDSSSPPVPRPGTPSMLSWWWSSSVKNGTKVQLYSAGRRGWITPARDALSRPMWGKPVGTFLLAPPAISESLVVIVPNAKAPSVVSLRAPNGLFLGVVRTRLPYLVFLKPSRNKTSHLFLLVRTSPREIRLKTLDGYFISAGSRTSRPLSLHPKARHPGSSETFTVREVMPVPVIRGVNLGGWLVAEEWMTPELFDGVPDVIDGLEIELRSLSTTLFVKIDLHGVGQIICASVNASSWERFQIRLVEPGADSSSAIVNIRAYNGSFWAVEPAFGLVFGLPEKNLSASAMKRGGAAAFEIHFSTLSNGTVALQSSKTGHFLRVLPNGNLVADFQASKHSIQDSSSPLWTSASAAFEIFRVSELRGEWQLSKGVLPRATLVSRLSKHRRTFVQEADFQFLRDSNINTVRIPVGFWTAQGASPSPPFVPGSLQFLDKAVQWGDMYGIRIIVCMHGAAGSQNGLEHSGSRDGVAEFGKYSANVDVTLKAIEFFAQRYSKQRSFFGVGLLNEPMVEGATPEVLRSYYLRAYNVVRKHSPCAFVSIAPFVDSDGSEIQNFMTTTEYSNVMVDVHMYNVFSDELSKESFDQNIKFIRNERSKYLNSLEKGTRKVMVGEWSLALPVNASDDGVKMFASVQQSVYGRTSAGWSFWSLKLNRSDDFPNWSLRDSIGADWLQQNALGGW